MRCLPGVDKLASDPRLRNMEEYILRELLVGIIRDYLESKRLDISAGKPCPTFDDIVMDIISRSRMILRPGLRRVINASGVIIHTNLGRAPVSYEAAAGMGEAARACSNLEFDLDSGRRGERNSHLERALCLLTGAEAAMVVNNNASAVLLALSAFARRKQVLVSRGQAVQIGGGFRIPDVMRQSGARLVEVGTANCTYISDYEQVIGPSTAAIMRVHLSNFRMTGFTHSVGLEEMVELAGRYGLPVFDDIGSGCLLDTARFGLEPEPTVQWSISAGASLVFFSADKLLGGPQGGVIVGRRDLVDRMKKHPLARALRIDKSSLAGLMVTLGHYLKGEAEEKVPVWRMIACPLDDIERRSELWADTVKGLARVVGGETMVGGGSLPGGTLTTSLVAIGGRKGKRGGDIARALGRYLRERELPVIGRVSGNDLLLDPRTVLPEDDKIVLEALDGAAGKFIE